MNYPLPKDRDTLEALNQELIRALIESNRKLAEQEKAIQVLHREMEIRVEARTQELRNANQQLRELAMTDPLTQVLNRRAFFTRLDEEIERAKRYQRDFVVLMIDVDHFKPFNDQNGHPAGDVALKEIAKIISDNLRKTDLLARYGGEEFVLLLPETNSAAGLEIGERLRLAVAEHAFAGRAGTVHLTLSVGLVGAHKGSEDPKTLIDRADDALYRAKNAGRNQISVV